MIGTSHLVLDRAIIELDASRAHMPAGISQIQVVHQFGLTRQRAITVGVEMTSREQN